MLTNDIYEVIKKSALSHNLEPALLLAVVDVESSGTPFWKVNGIDKPIVRFEGHYFYARLSGDKLVKATKEGLASKKVGGVANPSNGAARYQLIERAEQIDETAALESCSWGLGQIMGANWQSLGYPSVQALVSDAGTLEGQINMIIKFMQANRLIDKLRNKQWAAFARGYNGPKFGDYDKKLAAAYKKYLNPVVTNDNEVTAKDDISQMQTMLNAVGPYKLIVDGDFGLNTKTALRDFQLKNALVVDGKYGLLTKNKLQQVYLDKNKKTQNQFGAGTAAIGTAGTAITEAANQIEPLTYMSKIIQIVFIGLIVVGIGLTVWTLFFKKGDPQNGN